MPLVNPSILAWARETAGLSLEQAASKLKLNAAYGIPGAVRLAALESGEAEPTRAMLRRMSKQYRRSLVVFYMPAPPRRASRGEDFRTLPADISPAREALLDALVRDLYARQALLRAALEDEEEVSPLSLVGSLRLDSGTMEGVTALRRLLSLQLTDFRRASDSNAAFSLMRDHAETTGVFVLLVGDLGSHHTSLDTETFRGLAIADPIAPFVAINTNDSRSAWSFTLLHELAHILLGRTGVSGAHSEQAIEQFCNSVASEFLLPEEELKKLTIPQQIGQADLAALVSEYAKARNISRQLVSYRLYRLGAIGREAWQSLRAYFTEEWIESRRLRRAEAADASGGPNFFTIRRHRAGPALVNVTARMVASGLLTTSKAGKVLGVKPTQVPTMIGGLTTRNPNSREE